MHMLHIYKYMYITYAGIEVEKGRVMVRVGNWMQLVKMSKYLTDKTKSPCN